jgi:hypothetical protein
VIFSEPLWKKVLDGSKQITSRTIKPTTKCTCGGLYEWHHWAMKEGLLRCGNPAIKFGIDYFENDSKRDRVWFLPHGKKKKQFVCLNFSPAPYAIGKELCVQRKRGEGALCKCGRARGEHQKDGRFEDESKKEQGYYVHQFKPAKIKITGGMWRDEWLSKIVMKQITDIDKAKAERGDYDNSKPTTLPKMMVEFWKSLKLRDIDLTKDYFAEEAHCEGFDSWQALEARLKELNPKGLPLWRVEFDRVILK